MVYVSVLHSILKWHKRVVYIGVLFLKFLSHSSLKWKASIVLCSQEEKMVGKSLDLFDEQPKLSSMCSNT